MKRCEFEISVYAHVYPKFIIRRIVVKKAAPTNILLFFFLMLLILNFLLSASWRKLDSHAMESYDI